MSTNRENLSYPELFPTIERFLTSAKQFLRLFVPPGLGKTKATIDLILAHPEYKYLIVEPDHDITAGKGNLEDTLDQNYINWIHNYGKGRKVSEAYPMLFFDSDEEFCMLPVGEKYVPGCLGGGIRCPHYDECEWRAQRNLIKLRDVVICVFQNLHQMVELYKPDIIIFDESMENKIISTNKRFFSLDKLTSLGIELGKDVTPKHSYNRHAYKIYEASIPEKGVPELNEDDHFFNFFLKNISTMFTTKSVNKDGVEKYQLFGLPEQLIPDGKFKVIFNCATTNEDIMNYMFRTKPTDWEIFRYDVEIKNPMVRITGNWGISRVGFYNETIGNFINEVFQRKQNGDGFMITKKKFVKQLKAELDEPDRLENTHYMKCRGTNEFNREYLFAIAIGRFALKPIDYDKFTVIGLDKTMIESLEISEILQGIHRARLHLHPNTPVILFTMSKIYKSLAKTRKDFKVSSLVFVDIFRYHLWSTKELIAEGIPLKRAKKIVQFSRWLSKSILHDGIENQVMELTANGLTKKLIAEELGIGPATVSRIRKNNS